MQKSGLDCNKIKKQYAMKQYLFILKIIRLNGAVQE